MLFNKINVMKTIQSIKVAGINVAIYLILTVLIVVIGIHLWGFIKNTIVQHQEFSSLDLEKPMIRPYHDVFFYLDAEKLKADRPLYQKIQFNERLIETIVGLIYALLFIVLVLQLRKLVLSISQKGSFHARNLAYIKNIAWMLGIWILVDFICYQCIQFFIPFSLIEESINYVPLNKGFFTSFLFSVNYSMLLAAFSFYVISVVFKEGIDLKQQSDLTI